MTDEDGNEGRLLAEQQRAFAARALGTSWAIVAPLVGGYQQGALEVTNERGDRGVFKLAHPGDTVDDVADKAKLVDDAISRGWPAAKWITWGQLDSTAWFVQAFAEGQPLESITTDVEQAILSAVHRQTGLSALPRFNWSLHTSRIAAPGSYWHDRCRQFGGKAHELTRLLTAACEVNATTTAPTASDDLVHGDFATDNVLEHQGRITIIDTQSIGRGSRAVDLATMAVHCLAGTRRRTEPHSSSTRR